MQFQAHINRNISPTTNRHWQPFISASTPILKVNLIQWLAWTDELTEFVIWLSKSSSYINQNMLFMVDANKQVLPASAEAKMALHVSTIKTKVLWVASVATCPFQYLLGTKHHLPCPGIKTPSSMEVSDKRDNALHPATKSRHFQTEKDLCARCVS